MNLLNDELKRLQRQYRDILEFAKNKITTEPQTQILNEILMFWFENKKVVECALNWLSVLPYETFIFTAAVNLDYDEMDYIPFLMHGRKHILDDPVFKFAIANDSSKVLGIEFEKTTLHNVQEAINDNIKILDNLNELIYILPVSDIFTPREKETEIATAMICSMFNSSITSYQSYIEHCSNIKDVLNHLTPDASSKMVLNGPEDLRIDLSKRIEKFCKEAKHLKLDMFENEAHMLWVGLFSYILRASSVYQFCHKYKTVPFFRYDIVWHYFSMMCDAYAHKNNIELARELQILSFRAKVSFTSGKVLDRSKFENISINEFINAKESFNFEHKLLCAMDKTNENQGLISIMCEIFSEFYLYFKRQEKPTVTTVI